MSAHWPPINNQPASDNWCVVCLPDIGMYAGCVSLWLWQRSIHTNHTHTHTHTYIDELIVYIYIYCGQLCVRYRRIHTVYMHMSNIPYGDLHLIYSCVYSFVNTTIIMTVTKQPLAVWWICIGEQIGSIERLVQRIKIHSHEAINGAWQMSTSIKQPADKRRTYMWCISPIELK